MLKRRQILASLPAALAAPAILAPRPARAREAQLVDSRDHAIRVVTVADGLSYPWALAFLPGQEGFLVTEKTGTLRRFDPDGRNGVLIGGLPEIEEHGQGGLLDLILHPRFAETRLVYFSYALEVAADRYMTAIGRAVLPAGSDAVRDVQPILFRGQPASDAGQHFAGRMLFDREGMLFLAIGDRGQKEDAQDLTKHRGKMLRLTEDGAPAPGNPFAGQAEARPEIWSYGHRNPQGMVLSPLTGSLLIHEHGPQGGDEINVVRKGANYGWPEVTLGEQYGGGRIGSPVSPPGMTDPIYAYVPSIAPSGMAFYTGDRFPKWSNNLFLGALKLQHLNRLIMEGDRVVREERLLDSLGERIRDVRNGLDGHLWLLTDSGDGRVLRLEPA